MSFIEMYNRSYLKLWLIFYWLNREIKLSFDVYSNFTSIMHLFHDFSGATLFSLKVEIIFNAIFKFSIVSRKKKKLWLDYSLATLLGLIFIFGIEQLATWKEFHGKVEYLQVNRSSIFQKLVRYSYSSASTLN